MLRDLRIINFRGFADLKLEGLGRVNLIVGPNSAGKTSLLEAVSLAADPASVAKVLELFRVKDDLAHNKTIQWMIRSGAEQARFEAEDEAGTWEVDLVNQRDFKTPGNQIPFENGSIISYKRKPKFNVSSISVVKKKQDVQVAAFDKATRTADGEMRMEELLREVDPRIKAVRLSLRERLPIISIDMGSKERVPLSQVGEGISRLVTIFSELLGERAEICLIDEIENGIHYLALPQVWQGLAEIAEKQNIQIFATTHSGECLQAAHEIFASRDGEYALRVIQLYPVEERVEGRVLDQHMIEVGLSSNIDLR